MQPTHTAAVPQMTTKVQHVPHTGEWVVRVRIDGHRVPAQDYFTDDKADAENTAALMLATHEEQYPPRVTTPHPRPAPEFPAWREESCSGAFDGYTVTSDADPGL